MTTPMPEWMPPLPDVEQLIYQRCRTYVADNQRAAIEELMREYAEAYRKAWVASLKPVAWMNQVTGHYFTTIEPPPLSGKWVPLYRLDDQP